MNRPTGTDASPSLPPAILAGRPAPLTKVRVRRRWGRWALGAAGVVAVLGLAGVAVQRAQAVAARNETVRELPRRLVSRVDFDSKLTAAGRVESHSKTVINCEIERLSIYNEGRVLSSSGMTQVLEVIPEGTPVKKGDLLCRLNSSDYDELVRTQQMKTEQSRAALEQARLNFEVAELAVREYREGLRRQTIQELEGQITLVESDLQRARDRSRWTQAMLGKGYVPVAQRVSAEQAVAELEFKLQTARWQLKNFREYGDNRTVMELESEVEKRRYEVIANTQRVAKLDERLAHYRKMVDLCTIRSPHDGLLIYAIDPRRRNAPPLAEGVDVYQQQPLFYLPNLDRMEVVTYLHESIADKVVVGQRASARIEGFGNQVLPGRVVAVGPLPVAAPTWTTSEEVKFFLATIQLDENPAGLLPGMSAEVEVDLEGSHDVLAVPSEAIALERGQDVCYVAGLDGLERRRVTVGRSNRDLFEVTRGLAEGEAVVINPAKIDALDSLLTTHAPADPRPDTDPGAADAGTGTTGPVSVE